MAVNRKIYCGLFGLISIFMAGCGAMILPPADVELAPPAPSAAPLIPTLIATTQTSTPTATLTPEPTHTPTASLTPTPANPAVLGLSTGGYPMEVYRYGDGPISVILIGGIHGGYEWNTILLAYEINDYFSENPGALHPRLTVYIIPSANPDGQARVIGHAGRFTKDEIKGSAFEGRFNANGVDLNRNWDCDWSSTAVWHNKPLDPGKQPFSEVESRLLRDFILALNPAGVVFWHSAYPAVFPGACDGEHQPSQLLSNAYANSAGYPALKSFTSYEVSGDSTNWLALQDIPAIEVELTDHENTDFDKNLKGVLGMLEWIANVPP